MYAFPLVLNASAVSGGPRSNLYAQQSLPLLCFPQNPALKPPLIEGLRGKLLFKDRTRAPCAHPTHGSVDVCRTPRSLTCPLLTDTKTGQYTPPS